MAPPAMRRLHSMHRYALDAVLVAAALAVTTSALHATEPAPDWQSCARITTDGNARLACFDAWARHQSRADPPTTNASTAADSVGEAAPTLHATASEQPEPPEPASGGCRDGAHTTLSRFWELENDTDCGTLRFRGYRPLTVSVVDASNVNRQPTSENPLNDASAPIGYRRTEMRVQLSVRTKLAKGLLARGGAAGLDSLWAGYTQQSYWQLFSPGLSRPFRNTDHEPELVYVYPTRADLPWGWRLRYSGIGLVHQSNGQSLPLSRSWNRVYLMAGIERGDDWLLTARIWQRLHESAVNDDNPHISDYVGRSEFTLAWNATRDDTLIATLRHALRSPARGSLRLEWMHRLGDNSNLRLHTALFTGYGDSLIDYNHRRTVFSVGLSLLDF